VRSYIVSEKAKHFACSNQWVTRSETSRFHAASQWATRSEMFRFHSHNTYVCTIVVLVKEAKLLAYIQTMGNKKRNVSLPSHNTYICTIVVLVKEAKLLAYIQTMGNKKRNVSLPIPQHIYTAISIKVVPRAKRKSRIRARKAAGNRNSCMYNIRCVKVHTHRTRFDNATRFFSL
jgi:ethanolamine utilization protein EutP (predicted NTPase)